MTNRDIGDRLRVLEEENLRLKRALEELSLLNDLARAIGASLNSQEIINTVIRRSLRAVRAEQGVITLVVEEGGDQGKTLVRTMVSSGERQPFHLEQSIIGWMHLNKKPLLINDPRKDPRFSGVKWEESIRTLLAVPLLVKSDLIGVLTVYNKKGAAGFSDDDQRLLAIIAAQSAQVVENARLHEKEQALLRVQEELRVASRIQLRLLPKATPRVLGYDIAGMSSPALEVAGDYFDFIRLDEQSLAFCLGDVSGKGLPAALLMANLQAIIRGQAPSRSRPSECLHQANTLLHQSTEPQNYATLFYGILDAHRHELLYSSAGHEHPFLFGSDGSRTRLKTGGMVLSFLEDSKYEEESISLHPGDVLVVFSDGITEASDLNREEFGEERLGEVVARHLDKPATRLIEEIMTAVGAHTGERPPADDMTLVVVRRENG